MKKNLKNKRILILLRSFEIGGAERQAVMLANYLKREEKVEVAVWAYSLPGPILDLLDKDIPHKSIPFSMEAQNPDNERMKKRGLWKLAIRIFLFRPNIIMPFTITPNVDCGYIWRWTGAKSCIWNQRDEQFGFLDRKIESFGFHNTPVYVSNSRKGKELIEKNLKSKEKPVDLILNAVELPDSLKSRIAWRNELEISEETPVAIMVGNLSRNKDHSNLIRAWKIVIEKNIAEKKPILLLVGRFDETKDELQKLANDLGIGEYVRFLDFVKDIPGILKASDIGVFSSRAEGCPNGVLECMAASLPIVATDIAGTREVLGDDYPYFVPVNNPEIFAEKMIIFLKDKDLRKSVGIKNMERINSVFSPKYMYNNYKNLLLSLI